MGQITFNYTGQLAAAAGVSEEVFDLESGNRLRSALEELAGRHGDSFGALVFQADGRIRSTLLVVFDGVQASGDKETLSLEGVRNVMLMTPIAGG